MAQFKTSLVIRRLVEDVFTFVSNYQNSPQWVSGALEHTKVSAGPIGVGTVIRTTGRTMGLRIEATRIVTAYEPYARYAFKSEYRQVPLTTTFLFEPIQNSTRLTVVVEGEPTSVFRAATPLVLGMIRQQFEGDLRRLKTLLEEPERTAGTDPTQRFSSRVTNYVKYRPSYPAAVIDLLVAECRLTPDSLVADVGSGTGLLAELFLKAGNRVMGIEPNREMREAGERLLRSYDRFASIAATAEATTLPAHSVDFVTAGQSFHWFDQERAGAEFARILRPQGWLVLIWNERRIDSTPFLRAYERLLHTYSPEYALVNHKQVDRDIIQAAFPTVAFKTRSFDNRQRFDLEGVRGRLLSSSYAPEAGHPNHAPMLAELAAIFEAHQQNGEIVFEYDTRVNYGQLGTRSA